jgi:ABC-2 type transport system permease protein
MKNWKDYKITRYETYGLDSDVRSIGIRSSILNDRTVYISDPQLVREFNALLKSEILDQTYQDQNSSWESFASADIYPNNVDESSGKQILDRTNSRSTYEIKPTYTRLMAWLKDHKLYDQLQVSVNEIASAQFIKQEIDSPGKVKWVYADSQYINENLNGNRKVATKNKQIISELIQRQRSGVNTNRGTFYQIKLNLVKGQGLYMMLKEEDLTEDMKVILADL